MMAGAHGSPNLSSQHALNREQRMVHKSLKRLGKLHGLCTNPRLGLKNSPPYLPDLLRETQTLLSQVWEPYLTFGLENQLPRGDEAKYLRVQLRNLLEKLERAVFLFKDEKIFDETSSCRRNLTKLSLLFSHMLWELKAMFPGGRFQGDTFKVTKSEAEDFWSRSFGRRCIVQWKHFEEQLRVVHPFKEGMESTALKSTIDLTCNNHISVFEFDIFTKLFQPWTSLLRNWNHLAVTHPGYMAFLTYDQVIDRLGRYLHKPGSYIFRLSCTRMGQWAIGHVTAKGDIIQTIPENTPLYLALTQGFKERCYLYPDGRDVNPDLSSLCEPASKGKLSVTEEQYEIYCEIGSTFELCKICTERDKDTRIQPCGHLLCKPCLIAWKVKSAGHTCPYCRCDISGTQSVHIEPYLKDSKKWEEQGYEVEDEDHEDIELVIKQMEALKKVSSVSPQLPSTPNIPPRGIPASHCPSPSDISLSSCQAQTGTKTQRNKQHTSRCNSLASTGQDNRRQKMFRDCGKEDVPPKKQKWSRRNHKKNVILSVSMQLKNQKTLEQMRMKDSHYETHLH